MIRNDQKTIASQTLIIICLYAVAYKPYACARARARAHVPLPMPQCAAI